MLKKLKNWLTGRYDNDEDDLPEPLQFKGAYVIARPKQADRRKVADKPVGSDENLAPMIVDAGPGKTVLIRNRYVREDTGTHETLKILDESLVDSGEEAGIDPYNTGGFDRSKNWIHRFRK